VQQVSDTVAILNHGELVAQGAIERLLTGADGPVYCLSVKGDTRRTLARIQALPWVSGVDTCACGSSTGKARRNGCVTWQVGVTDEQAAEAHLLRQVLADESLTVVEFSRKRYELEEIFISIVEGGDHGR
jgi:ABC-type multidrug transport system ATPase subunit